MPYFDIRDQQEEERLIFFPGKDSSNEKAWTFCFLLPS